MNALKKFFLFRKNGFPSINFYGAESRFEIDIVSANPPEGFRYRVIVWTDEPLFGTSTEVKDFLDEDSLRRFLMHSDQKVGYAEHCEQCDQCGHYDHSQLPSYYHHYEWNRKMIEKFIQEIS